MNNYRLDMIRVVTHDYSAVIQATSAEEAATIARELLENNTVGFALTHPRLVNYCVEEYETSSDVRNIVLDDV